MRKPNKGEGILSEMLSKFRKTNDTLIYEPHTSQINPHELSSGPPLCSVNNIFEIVVQTVESCMHSERK